MSVALLIGVTILAACQPGSSLPPDTPWVLNADESGMTYVTIKNGSVGEINTFRTISGSVSPDGNAEFIIDLKSVDTNNEIRDGRMQTVLFDTPRYPTAKVTTKIDMAPYTELAIGDSRTELIDLTLALHGLNWEQGFYVQTTRLGENKVVVTNKAPLLLDATDFGFSDGLDKLQSLAGLTSISPVVPVTVSLVFERK